MKAYALLGGPTNLWPADIQARFRKAQKNGDLIVGVDRGSLFLEEMRIIPDLALGDFDSLHSNDLARIEKNVKDIRYSNPVKDWTDSELMLRTVFKDYGVSEVYIFGATGGRIDHFLVNLLMILNPAVREFANKICIIDQQNMLRFYNPGKYLIPREDYSYVSFAALTAIKNFNILGARYELKNYSGDYPRVFSSNEFLPGKNNCEISFEKGIVAAIYAKDVDRFHNLA